MTVLQALRPFAATKGLSTKPRCELCSAPLGEDHGHVADVQSRSLACACAACALLFKNKQPGDRWRTLPDRYLVDPHFTVSEADWSALDIPVAMAFFFRSTSATGWTAVYPSPAGAVESSLRLDVWTALAREQRLAQCIEPDLEALLVVRRDEHFECMLVPIHTCYALVGRVRRRWRGLKGGDARSAMDDYLRDVRTRCEVLVGGGP
jgi:hypothetical protein